MNRTIALTGATGFIGSALARRLSAGGWSVRALVRPSSSKVRVAGLVTERIDGTLEDLASLRCLVKGAETVVHCAGLVRAVSQEDFIRVNVDGVTKLAHAAAEQQPSPRFLLLSSLAAREPDVSPYAASKRQGEMALTAAAGEMAWTVLRPPAVYGLGDQALPPLLRWMARGLAPVLGPETVRFSLLHVDDLAEAVLRCLDSGIFERRTFELHDGHLNGYTWSEVIDTVARLRARSVLRVKVPETMLELVAKLNTALSRIAGSAPMLTPWKVRELQHPNWVCDNGAISRAIGWVPRVSLEDGLRLTLGLETPMAASALGQR